MAIQSQIHELINVPTEAHYWECNLRFKTDTSAIGPVRGAPATIGAGMAVDRASVIFSAPEKISAWIKIELLI